MSTPAKEIGNETFEYPGTGYPVLVSIREAEIHAEDGIEDSISMYPRLKSWMSEALKAGLTQSPGAP